MLRVCRKPLFISRDESLEWTMLRLFLLVVQDKIKSSLCTVAAAGTVAWEFVLGAVNPFAVLDISLPALERKKKNTEDEIYDGNRSIQNGFASVKGNKGGAQHEPSLKHKRPKGFITFPVRMQIIGGLIVSWLVWIRSYCLDLLTAQVSSFVAESWA